MPFSREHPDYISGRGIQINRIDLPDKHSFWYPMQTNCVICQKPLAPSVKYTTCGDKTCIEFRNKLYCKSDEYKRYKFFYMRWYRTTDKHKAFRKSKEYKDYMRAYRKTDKFKAYRKEYYQQNLEKMRKYFREYARKHRKLKNEKAV